MVNEESSAKSLHFMVEKGAKPTVRMFMNILKAYMRHRHDKKYFGKEKEPTGKMPVKKLIKQGKGAQKIELDGEDIHLFNRLAKKYDSNVLYANALHHRADALSSIAALAGLCGRVFY